MTLSSDSLYQSWPSPYQRVQKDVEAWKWSADSGPIFFLSLRALIYDYWPMSSHFQVITASSEVAAPIEGSRVRRGNRTEKQNKIKQMECKPNFLTSPAISGFMKEQKPFLFSNQSGNELWSYSWNGSGCSSFNSFPTRQQRLHCLWTLPNALPCITLSQAAHSQGLRSSAVYRESNIVKIGICGWSLYAPIACASADANMESIFA